MARPSSYDKKYCAELIAFCKQGYSYEAFAGHIGVSKVTLYAWEKVNPEFLNAKRIARAACQKFHEGEGRKLVNGTYRGGSAAVWIFMMKNMCGWRDDPIPDDDDAIDGLEFVNEDQASVQT